MTLPSEMRDRCAAFSSDLRKYLDKEREIDAEDAASGSIRNGDAAGLLSRYAFHDRRRQRRDSRRKRELHAFQERLDGLLFHFLRFGLIDVGGASALSANFEHGPSAVLAKMDELANRIP